MRDRARILLVLGLVALGACVRIGSYACADDDACTSRDGGRCEATSFCSYPDDACASQRRYGDQAGALAGTCTEPDDATSSGTPAPTTDTTTATSTGTSTDASSSSSSSSSTTDGPPQPGDATWVMYRGAPLDAKFNNVVEIDTDDFVVCGSEVRPRTGEDVLLARYDVDGNEQWATLQDYVQATDICYDLVFGSGGALFAVGQQGNGGTISPWIACFRPEDGSECWHQVGIGFSGRGIAYTIDALVVAVGTLDPLSGGFAAAYQGWGEPAYEHALPDGALLGAVATGRTAFVGGERLGDLLLGTYDESGVAELASMPGPSRGPDAIQRLATDGESIYAVGYAAGATSIDPWIGRYTLAGELVWENHDGVEMLDEEHESVAIDASGDIFVVGFTTVDDKDSVVSRWTSDGELVWHRTYPELSFGDDIARDVLVSSTGELLVVGEARTERVPHDGYAMRVVP